MRRALRERPLPHDVGELLTLVGGSPAALAAAAGHCGETSATVLEAARFFVQEVLLFPEADAYRVLGLDPSASDGRIKAHYRALQHWLHPDRRGSDLESAYATRINGAWMQLRNSGRRRAYDSAHGDGSESVPVATHAARVRLCRRGAEADRTAPWKWIVPVAAALALCVWLGWMASRESSTPGETNERDASAQPGRAGEAEIAVIARTAPH